MNNNFMAASLDHYSSTVCHKAIALSQNNKIVYRMLASWLV